MREYRMLVRNRFGFKIQVVGVQAATVDLAIDEAIREAEAAWGVHGLWVDPDETWTP